jgi:hypothetical protein
MFPKMRGSPSYFIEKIGWEAWTPRLSAKNLAKTGMSLLFLPLNKPDFSP